jgi:DNA invertase Pin-like site-specific DNA recombinase
MDIAIVRLSNDKSDEDRQKFILKNHFKKHNITDVKYVEDIGISGGVPIFDRPKLGPVLKAAPKGTTVYVSDLSRLGRLDYDMMKFRDNKNFNLVVCNNPEITEDKNRIMFGVNAIMDDQYRRDLSAKQKEKCLEMKTSIAEKGYYITKSTNRKMTKLGVHNSMDKARSKATEAVKQKAMRDLSKVQIHLNDAKNHSKSLLGMANYLNVRNIKTARGCSWSASTVKRALDRISTLH